MAETTPLQKASLADWTTCIVVAVLFPAHLMQAGVFVSLKVRWRILTRACVCRSDMFKSVRKDLIALNPEIFENHA